MYNKKLLLEALKNMNETPKMKKGGVKKFSSNLQATNRLYKKNNLFKKNKLYKDNPIFKKPNYKGKTYDPQAMYFAEGGYIIDDPSIPVLNQFAKGGTDCGEGFTYDPKLGCIPESEESLTDEQKWMINWYKNRKIEFPEDQQGFKKANERLLPFYNPESPMVRQMESFPVYETIPEEYMEEDPGGYPPAGMYDGEGKVPKIYFSPELNDEQRSDTEIHELTNHFMKKSKDLYPMYDKIIKENIIPFDKTWPKEKQDFYDYIINPEEQNIQSYLNVARKKFNLKPDEVVTPERLNKMREEAEKKGLLEEGGKNFNPDIFLLFRTAKDDESLMKLFNLIAQNKNESDVQYGKYGTQMQSLQRFVRGGGPGDKYYKNNGEQFKKTSSGQWFVWNPTYKSWHYVDSGFHNGIDLEKNKAGFTSDDSSWETDKPKSTAPKAGTIEYYEEKRNKVLNNPLATTEQKIKATQSPIKSNVELNKNLVEQKKQEDYIAEQEKLRKLQEEQRRKEEEELRLMNPNFYNSETTQDVARESGALLTKKEQEDYEAHKKDLGEKKAYLGRAYVHENYVALESEETNNAMYGLKGITWDDADKLASFVLDDVVSGGYGYGLDDDLKAAFPNATPEQIKKYKDHITKARNDANRRIINTVSGWDLKEALRKRHYYDTPTRPEDNVLKAWDKNDPNLIELSGRMPETAGEWGTRIADIVANPLDAIHYGMSSTESMPMNMYEYEKAKQQLGFEDGTDRNAVNEGLDFASWFTGAGTVAQGMKMLRPTGEAVSNFAEDPSWESAGTAAMNVGFNALALSPLGKIPGANTKSLITNPTSRYAGFAKLPGNRQIIYGNPYLTEAESVINLPGFKLARGNAPTSGLPAMPVTPFNYTQNVGKTVLGLTDEATQGLLPTITEPHVVTESPLTVGTSATPNKKPFNLDKAIKDENLSRVDESIGDDVINFSKDDNQVASDIINDIRERKLELWQTPEGQNRLQKMIDNTPSLQGQTPESMMEGIASMTNLNTFYAEDLATKESIISEMNQLDAIHEQGQISDTDYFNKSVALDQALKDTENLISQSEQMLNKHYGFYSGEANVVGVKPGVWKDDEIAKIGSHELGHFLGSYSTNRGTTYLDDKLKNLKLIPDAPEQLKMQFPTEPGTKSTAYDLMGEGRGDYLSKSKKYFEEGSGGTERVPFLAEVREDMLQKGIIKSEYDPITPKMLKEHYKDYKNIRGEKYPLRIYDIIKSDSENFNIMSEVLNYLPVISAVATAYDAVTEDESNPTAQEAGINPGLFAIFASFAARKPNLKLPAKLTSALKSFKKGTWGAVNELINPKYFTKQLDKYSAIDKKLKEELGYFFDFTKLQDAEPGLLQKASDIESKIKMRERKFGRYFDKKRIPTVDKNGKIFSGSPLEEKQLFNKQQNIDQYQNLAKSFEITPEGMQVNHPGIFEGVTTTGKQTITDLSTGQKIVAEVEMPKYKVNYTKKDGNLQIHDNSIIEPVVSPEYVTSLKNSIAKVQTDVPGAKVFGSSVLVTEAGMPHITGDIDVLISQSDYNKNVRDKFNYVGPNGPAEMHAVYPEYGEEGTLDFNIIHEDAKGMVEPYYDPSMPDKTPTEIELFRQFYPDEFQKASQVAMETGNPIKINMSSKEFMKNIDTEVKTIIDAYEATPISKWDPLKSNDHKIKHVLRPNVLIAHGKPNVVAKGQEAYIKSVVGSKGTLGYQFPKEQLEDPSKNIMALYSMNFQGDILEVAQNPERMQLALNDYYINHTVFSREISAENLPGEKYEPEIVKVALTEWFPGKGLNVHGMGLNTVQKGNPGHIPREKNPVIGHRQIGFPTNTTDPYEYVKSIEKATSGTYNFTPEELTELKTIFSKYVPDVSSQIEGVKTSRDLLEIHPNDYNKGKQALDEMSEKFGIRAIRKDQDPNGVYRESSVYASLFGKFDEALDAMSYSLKEYHAVPKSNATRQKRYEEVTQKRNQSHQLNTVKDFNKIYNILNGGLSTAELRQKTLQESLTSLKQQQKDLIEKFNQADNEAYAELEFQIAKANQELYENQNLMRGLHQRKNKMDKMRNILLPTSIVAGIAIGTGLTINSINKDHDKTEKDILRAKEKLKDRGILINRIDPYNPFIMKEFLINNPNATKWPTGEEIIINPDSSVQRPITTTLKDGKVVWDMPKKTKTKLNKKSLGGENEMEMELTQKEIDDLVARGYIVTAK